MRKKWHLHNYKPVDIVRAIFTRASKNRPLVWPDCEKLLIDACQKYSFTPERTIAAIIPDDIYHQRFLIKRGVIDDIYEVRERAKEEHKKRMFIFYRDNCDGFFLHLGIYYRVCENCNKCEVVKEIERCRKCKTCYQKHRHLSAKENEVYEIKSLINKVTKLCRNQSKQQAI
jgi:hypothetical protein